MTERFDSNKANLYCAEHHYYGPSKDNNKIKPTLGCRNCWMVFYFKQLLDTPPQKRAQFLEELTETLRDVNQLIGEGKWDLKLHRPQVTIEHEPDNA